MSSALDMSLDDLIKNNKKPTGGTNSRGRGRGSGPGPTRRFQNRGSNRAAPYSMGRPIPAPDSAWQHDMFADQAVGYAAPAARPSAIETGTKLYISNLDYGVSNEDIKGMGGLEQPMELFSEVGDLKRYSIHYDRSGRSKGTAEVVFSRRADAAAAVKRYNNVQLDGKPMKIEIVGTNIATPAATPAATSQVLNGAFGSLNGVPAFGSLNGVPRGGQGRGFSMGRPRGGGGGGSGAGSSRGGGRGRGRGRGRGDQISAADLDAELEKYHSEAMQIN